MLFFFVRVKASPLMGTPFCKDIKNLEKILNLDYNQVDLVADTYREGSV